MASSENSERQLLLDSNVLVVLARTNHRFHDLVVTLLKCRPVATWATCALTQLGFARGFVL